MVSRYRTLPCFFILRVAGIIRFYFRAPRKPARRGGECGNEGSYMTYVTDVYVRRQ